MSVICHNHDCLPGHGPSDWTEAHLREPLTCFLCGERVCPPLIEWSGCGATIALHPACAVDLTIRLMRDVHALECHDGLAVGMVVR